MSQNESFQIKGEDLIKRVKELINEGNIRQLTVKTKEGKTLIVVPLTIGVVGTLLAPELAALGALAALLTDCIITVERVKESE